ncbi:P.94 [Cedecea neteri]|uniref:P.94 n=1 Tax=Cedecea neteri TaxID=158822 RepID=A0A2X2T908_9ENTR|nr:P.94 [Cedecea neteri]
MLFGFSRATGDVDGFALAKQGARVGKLQLNNYNYGGYWTRVAASGWYTDAVLMGSALRLNTDSVNDVNASSSGKAVTGSVEAGLPVALGEGLTLEPQAQLVWQRTSLDSLHDGVSDVRWNNGNTWQGRVGARLQWAFEASGVNWKPYLRANVLRSFGQDDETDFDGSTTIANSIGQNGRANRRWAGGAGEPERQPVRHDRLPDQSRRRAPAGGYRQCWRALELVIARRLPGLPRGCFSYGHFVFSFFELDKRIVPLTNKVVRRYSYLIEGNQPSN